MTRRHVPSFAVLAVVLLVAGCSTPDEGKQQDAPEAAREQSLPPDHPEQSLPPDHPPLDAAAADAGMTESGTVLEVIAASGYAYLRVDTAGGERWLAAPQLAVEAGDRVAWAPGTPMPGWHSETLNRTWDEVDFVSQIQVQGTAPAQTALPPAHPPLTTTAAVDVASIEKLEGGLTVAELYSRAGELAGQRVSLRGRVAKANLGIMGSNWLHLRDGTGDAAAQTDDITVTTQDRAAVGDLVVVEGTLVTDKDFGAGYRYPVLLENAAVEVEPEAPE